jgi:hypothetical protein
LNIKPSVDNREPKKYVRSAATKNSATIEKQRMIDQENSLLLKRMLSIIKRKNPTIRDSSMPATLQSTIITGANPGDQVIMPLQRSQESRRGDRKQVTSANTLAQGVTLLSTTTKLDHFQQPPSSLNLPHQASQL